jgi:REP element-mobilizing transposase RayT
MPRPPRVYFPGALYHAILRGNHRQPTFLEPAHYHYFSWLVRQVVEDCALRLHAYCWMPNHVHLAVQVSEAPLGAAMQRIGSRYARHVQRDIPTTGHFFQDRHRAILVNETRYLLELVRYIHLNPVRAGLVRHPGEYRWSSHAVYMGRRHEPWVTTAPTLRLFAERAAGAHRAFESFVLAGIGQEPPAALREGEKESTEEPAGETSAATASFAVERERARDDGGFDGLVERVCARHRVAAADLSSRSRAPALCQARGEIAREALRLGLATLSEVARRLKRSPSTVSECARRRS